MIKFRGADHFCGAGGFSTAMIAALKELGYKEDEIDLVVINHWPLAIQSHTANHPWARHLCQNVDAVQPLEVVPGGRLDLLVASPECLWHSKARGGKPINDQRRSSAWQIVRWAETLHIKNILIENVRELLDWGPIYQDCDCGAGIDADIKLHTKKCRYLKPIPEMKGKTYLAFIGALESLGYNVSHRVITCADYGDPTTRARLFIMATLGRRPVWPEPTHAKTPGVGMFTPSKHWKPARDIIDWTLKGESIFGRKHPLKPNTMRRIMKGLMKYSGLPFVIGQQSGAAPRSVSDPLPTVAGAGAISVIEPFLVVYHSDKAGAERVNSVDAPLPTVDTSNRFGLVESYIVKLYNTNVGSDIDQPLPTVTATGNHLFLADPYIVSYYGKSNAGSVDEPLPTVTAQSQHLYLAEPYIVACNHGDAPNRSHSVDQPFPTVTGVDAWAICEPYLVKYNSTGGPLNLDDPLDTISTHDRFGLVLPMINGDKVLVDIRFRMLQPHELSAAMSFPSSYKFAGNRGDKVKQIGNAVPVQTAKALIKGMLE
jgi:DNA (cytosine-5)-methyltransferase 1